MYSDSDYPSTAFDTVVSAGPNADNISALIGAAVRESATNRKNASNAGDVAGVSMMSQRLLTLAQLRNSWLGQGVSTDLQDVIAAADKEAAFGGIFSGIGIGAIGGVALIVGFLLLSRPRR